MSKAEQTQTQAQSQSESETRGRRFPCTCERGLGDAMCFGCLHEANLGREENASWKSTGGDA